MAQTPFGEIADAAHAQAFNEPIERRGEFKVAADYSTYPPEPAYLVGTCVTFIKDDGSLSTKMAVAETDLTHPPRSIDTVVDHFLEDYEERVAKNQPLADKGWEHPLVAMREVAESATQLSYQHNFRTVVAFTLFEARDSTNHFSGLLIPKIVLETIPLQDRERILTFERELMAEGFDPKDLPADVKETFGKIKQNDPIHRNLAVVSLTKYLPPLEFMKEKLTALKSQSPSAPSAPPSQSGSTINRAQRRQQEREQRRRR